ncbi:MAG: tetratricopeptide repeat protein [Pseudomonadota bacterium]
MAKSWDQRAAPTPEPWLETAIAARRNGDLAQAAQVLDRALTTASRHPIALRLRARVALERGEADALGRFDAALRAEPGNADLHLGKAQALDLAGDAKGARIVARQISEQAPGFIAALSFLSGLYLADGEADFTAPFAAAAEKAPQDPNILAGWIDALAGIERFAEAAAIAAGARACFPAEPHFALLEAMHAGAAGDWTRAEAIFEGLPTQSAPRWLAEARHRLRAGDAKPAEALVDRALERAPADIAAWALMGVIWRLSEDPRSQEQAHWLHEQAGLVQFVPLEAEPGVLERARARLEELHKTTATPLNQSVRGGSQTRGVLFQRPDPALSRLHEAIRATLETYRRKLPPADPAHPLLAQREAPWRLAGSWSVRLKGAGDHHAAHIHPAGLISSALYLALPPQTHGQGADDAPSGDAQPGALELGRPPADLGLELAPIATLRPQEGYLALFPSTLYHGTLALSEPRSPRDQRASASPARLTVAFDVITNDAQV